MTTILPPARRIPTGLSLYLDLLRFLAALSVLLYHTWAEQFPGSGIKWPGHEAVVVFFVLSGYVIAHASSAPGTTLSSYVQHRVARILPVAYAALLLAVGLCLLLPELASKDMWWSTLGNMLFLAQSGPLALNAPLNPPFWSLNYEVWYYVLFGIWSFAPARWRSPLLIAAALLAGPKILLLLPVWLGGVLLYRRMPALRPAAAWACLVLSIGAFACLTWLNVSDLLRNWLYANLPGAWRLNYSTQFLYDWLLGLVVMLHFVAIAALGPALHWLARIERPLRYLAGCTFSLYVFHGPLLEAFRHAPMLRASPCLFYLAMAMSIVVLAELTERRVKRYRALVAALAGRLGARRPPGPAQDSGESVRSI